MAVAQARDQVAQVRLYHQLTLPKTPFALRGVPTVTVPEAHSYDGCAWNSEARCDGPPAPWAAMFGTRPQKAEPCFRNRLATHKPYDTKSPARSQVAIAAAQALRNLVHAGTPQLAALAWQTCALTPHTLVRHRKTSVSSPAAEGAYSFVLATAVYAARLVPCQQVGEGKWVALVDAPWEWCTVTEVESWCSVPFSWTTNDHECSRHGFLAMEQSGTMVPVVAGAFAQTRHRRLLAHHRKRLLALWALHVR